MSADDPRLLLLDPGDNVLVARDQIRSGERILVGGETIALAFDLKLGHKLARRAISSGERILKYGAPIGRATRAIAMGEHVHVHNVVSDYTPTYVIDDGGKTA
jgi:altronate dehydratase small subunit